MIDHVMSSKAIDLPGRGVAGDLAFVRYYVLPISSSRQYCAPYAELLGTFSDEDRDMASIERAVVRALSGNYHAVKFPANALAHSSLAEAAAMVAALGMSVILDVHFECLSADVQQRIASLAGRTPIFVNLHLGTATRAEFADIKSLFSGVRGVYLTLVVTRDFDPLPVLCRLDPADRAHTFFYFPAPQANFRVKEAAEIFRDIRKMRAHIPDLVVRPSPGIDVFEPGIDAALDLEPLVCPLRTWNDTDEDCLVSVVIPGYNCATTIAPVLKHLLRQDLDDGRFEIIVVDDGSSDGTAERVIAVLDQEIRTRACVKLLALPRPRARQMGDSQYRAGIARNAGVKHTRGRYLLFLDADVILPPYFLRLIATQHKWFDVLQGRRYDLRHRQPHVEPRYEDLTPERDIRPPSEVYWPMFYDSALKQGWDNLSSPWKYVCTYCLSMTRENFLRVGWFRKCFMFYGNEDTELGFRLHRAGLKFNVLRPILYHIPPTFTRSECRSSEGRRQMLLGRTARIFYRNSLDERVFSELQTYMRSSPFLSLGRLVQSARGLLAVFLCLVATTNLLGAGVSSVAALYQKKISLAEIERLAVDDVFFAWITPWQSASETLRDAFQKRYPKIQIYVQAGDDARALLKFENHSRNGLGTPDVVLSSWTSVLRTWREEKTLADISSVVPPAAQVALCSPLQWYVINSPDSLRPDVLNLNSRSRRSPMQLLLPDPRDRGLGEVFYRFVLDDPEWGQPWLNRAQAQRIKIVTELNDVVEAMNQPTTIPTAALIPAHWLAEKQLREPGTSFPLVSMRGNFAYLRYEFGVRAGTASPWAARLFLRWLATEGRKVVEEAGIGCPRETLARSQFQNSAMPEAAVTSLERALFRR